MCYCGMLFKSFWENPRYNVYEPLPPRVAPATVIGMARVVVQSANINKNLRVSRPYVVIQVQGGTVARTKVLEEKT
jgi:hypothetical protein